MMPWPERNDGGNRSCSLSELGCIINIWRVGCCWKERGERVRWPDDVEKSRGRHPRAGTIWWYKSDVMATSCGGI